MVSKMKLLVLSLFTSALLVGCQTADAGGEDPTPAPVKDNCSNADGALTDVGFVIVTSHSSGDRVKSGFVVKGCSRSFESHVPWELVGRDRKIIASGFTQGGGVDGGGPYEFTVNYKVSESQWAVLRVLEDDPSDGEGGRPKNNEIPVYLIK